MLRRLEGVRSCSHRGRSVIRRHGRSVRAGRHLEDDSEGHTSLIMRSTGHAHPAGNWDLAPATLVQRHRKHRAGVGQVRDKVRPAHSAVGPEPGARGDGPPVRPVQRAAGLPIAMCSSRSTFSTMPSHCSAGYSTTSGCAFRVLNVRDSTSGRCRHRRRGAIRKHGTDSPRPGQVAGRPTVRPALRRIPPGASAAGVHPSRDLGARRRGCKGLAFHGRDVMLSSLRSGRHRVRDR